MKTIQIDGLSVFYLPCICQRPNLTTNLLFKVKYVFREGVIV